MKKPYSGGGFKSYYNPVAVLLEGTNTKTLSLIDDFLVIRDIEDFINLYEVIGNNTDYIDHPDEILAENFRKLVAGSTLPDEHITDQMRSLMR